MYMRPLWTVLHYVLSISVVPAHAQFTGIATTQHGIDLYLSTNLPLKGSGQPEQGRIHRLGPAPLSVVASTFKDGPNPCILSRLCVSSYYDLSHPDISRDGKILAFTGRADCVGSCQNAGDLHRTTVRGVPGKGDLFYAGQAWLSGNGRYLVGFEDYALAGYTRFYRVDFSTGEFSHLPSIGHVSVGTPGSGRIVADSGDFVFTIDGKITVFRNGQWNPVPFRTDTSPNSYNAVIDSNANAVVYLACCSPYSHVRVLHLESGEDEMLFQGNGQVYQPQVSQDGKTIMFLTTAKVGTAAPPGAAQVYRINVDGRELRAMTNDPDSVVQFVASDDGETIWYVNSTGSVFQMSTRTGEAQRRLPSTCKASLESGIISPGSAWMFGGSCLGQDFKVSFDGLPGPFISRTGSGMWVQVPWTVDPSKPVAVLVESESPFGPALATTANAVPTRPLFASAGIHQDWSGVVNASRPAQPKEIVHFYATGLGPVQPPIRTASPGPSSPPALIATPFECNLPVMFAGLAPGLVGFYQVSVQMPDSGGGFISVSCTGGASTGVYFQQE